MIQAEVARKIAAAVSEIRRFEELQSEHARSANLQFEKWLQERGESAETTWPQSKAEARAHALAILQNTATAFADGSQAFDEHGEKWAIVNIASSTCIPGHEKKWVEDARAIGPGEIDAWLAAGAGNIHEISGLYRFQLEIQALISAMRSHPGLVAIVDGSIVPTFACRLAKPMQEKYAALLQEALRVAKTTNSIFLGYIHEPKSRDLARILDIKNVVDAKIVAPTLPLLGQTTPSIVCDRQDGSGRLLGDEEIAFHHVRFDESSVPRLEYPRWLSDQQVAKATDILVAHAIFNHGYPRGIDECHSRTTIRRRDAGALQVVVNQALQSRVDGKNLSKIRGNQ